MQCQGKVEGRQAHEICASVVFKCQKCGAEGCSNRRCADRGTNQYGGCRKCSGTDRRALPYP